MSIFTRRSAPSASAPAPSTTTAPSPVPAPAPPSAASGPLSPGAPLTIGATRASIAPEDPVQAAWSALSYVYDPELCLDVVSLGLVYDVRAKPEGVVVEMTLTTPGCPASESLPAMARAAVAGAIGGDADVDVDVVWEPPWNPTMMSDDAAGALGFKSR